MGLQVYYYFAQFGHVADMIWSCFGHVLDMHWPCFRHDLHMFFKRVLDTIEAVCDTFGNRLKRCPIFIPKESKISCKTLHCKQT